MTDLSLIAQFQMPPTAAAAMRKGLFHTITAYDAGARVIDHAVGVGFCRHEDVFDRALAVQRHWDAHPGTTGLVGDHWDVDTPNQRALVNVLHEHRGRPDLCKLAVMYAGLLTLLKWHEGWVGRRVREPLNCVWDACLEAGFSEEDLWLLEDAELPRPVGSVLYDSRTWLYREDLCSGTEFVLKMLAEGIEDVFRTYAFTEILLRDAPDPEVRAHLDHEYAMAEPQKIAKGKPVVSMPGFAQPLVWPLEPEDLRRVVWQKSRLQLAEQFGVSDVAIAKRCKKFGITMPPRGYWAKLYGARSENFEKVRTDGVLRVGC